MVPLEPHFLLLTSRSIVPALILFQQARLTACTMSPSKHCCVRSYHSTKTVSACCSQHGRVYLLLASTACCLQDPVRKEVPDAVRTCHRAGILVRMVTGDNIHTARHIARECGILTEGGLALEGPKFREMPEEELLELLPRLQVSTECCTLWK